MQTQLISCLRRPASRLQHDISLWRFVDLAILNLCRKVCSFQPPPCDICTARHFYLQVIFCSPTNAFLMFLNFKKNLTSTRSNLFGRHGRQKHQNRPCQDLIYNNRSFNAAL